MSSSRLIASFSSWRSCWTFSDLLSNLSLYICESATVKSWCNSDGQRLNGFLATRHNSLSHFSFRVVEEGHKFVSSIANTGIILSHFALKNPANSDEYFVASLMPVLVVDRLKIVQIHYQNDHFFFEA